MPLVTASHSEETAAISWGCDRWCLGVAPTGSAALLPGHPVLRGGLSTST